MGRGANWPKTKFTIAYWLKIENKYTGTLNPAFVSSRSGIALYNGKSLKAYATSLGNGILTRGVQVNKWQHFVFSYDGNFLKLWIDGNLITTQKSKTNSLLHSGFSFYIGNSRGTNSSVLIDDVFLSPYAFDGQKFY